MIPSRSHLRIVILTIKTSFALGLAVVVLLIGHVISQFDGNAVFPADCAIVFGAAVHGTGNAGPGITRRVSTAADLYHAGDVQKIFLTGGKGDENKESEAHVMRKVALLHGVDPEDIVLEETATSTIENILYTTPLLKDCDSIVGISDRYHLARIRFLADTYNLELDTYPAEHLPTRAFETRAILREVAAFLYTFGIRLQNIAL
jgi:vancomycin permeability regulator SanA